MRRRHRNPPTAMQRWLFEQGMSIRDLQARLRNRLSRGTIHLAVHGCASERTRKILEDALGVPADRLFVHHECTARSEVTDEQK